MNIRMHPNFSSYFQHFLRSVWLFPVIVLVLFAVLVSLGISGTSVGIYNDYLNPGAKDANLLAGEPRGIRSDEWWVTAPTIMSQEKDGFPNVNKSIGDGQDMNVISDIPTHSWVQIFRPQNWGFYILPLENAYSFRWFALPMLLIITAYFFALQHLPRRRLMATLLSLGLFFSPFFHWWSLGGTTGIIATSLLMLLSFSIFLSSTKRSDKLVFSLLFTYAAICFALYAYPPFQLPCALVLFAYVVGLLFKDGLRGLGLILRKNWIYFIIVLSVSIGTVLLFLKQNSDTVATIQNTSYPGKRVIPSGGYTVSHLLSGGISYKLQNDDLAVNYKDISSGATNQSEAATFIFTGFFTAPLLFYLMYKYRRLKFIKQEIILVVGLMVSTTILLSWMFIPGLDALGSVLKLNTVPIGRAVIGLGLSQFIFLCLFIKLSSNKKITLSRRLVASLTLSLTVLFTAVNYQIALHNPAYLGLKQLIAASLVLPLIVYLLSSRRIILGLSILVAFSLLCVYNVNPVYRGLGPLKNSQLYNAVSSSKWNGRWAIEDPIFSGVLTATSVKTMTGVYVYPQLSMWKSFGEDYKQTYNRYARVTISIDKDPASVVATKPVLTSPDAFTIQTEPCSEFMKLKDVSNVITNSKLPNENNGCIIDMKEVRTGGRTLYLYRLDN